MPFEGTGGSKNDGIDRDSAQPRHFFSRPPGLATPFKICHPSMPTRAGDQASSSTWTVATSPETAGPAFDVVRNDKRPEGIEIRLDFRVPVL
jgi:hypothetical protein